MIKLKTTICRRNGSALVIAVFAIALIATLVSGLLLLTTEQLQLMHNQVGTADAFNIAEAGINDAMAEIRSDSSWHTGFSAKSFAGGTYTVDVNNTSSPTIIISSSAVASSGFTARLCANCTISGASPTPIRINELLLNQ